MDGRLSLYPLCLERPPINALRLHRLRQRRVGVLLPKKAQPLCRALFAQLHDTLARHNVPIANDKVAMRILLVLQGDLRDPRSLRVSARACPAATRWLARESKADLSPLQGDGLAAQEQDTQAPGEGEAARGPVARRTDQRNLGDGFYP